MTFGFAQIGLDPNIKKKTPSKRSRKSRGYQLNILLRYLKILFNRNKMINDQRPTVRDAI
jgi:hypothetical protein